MEQVNAGLDGSNAGTALRASLLALNNPAKAQARMMDELGFTMIDAEGNAKGLSTMIADLAESTAHMSEADRVATVAKLVGTEATSGFLALMKAGPAVIDKNTEALRNSEGAAAEAAAQMKAGIGGALENLSGAFESLTITIGDQLVPYVQMAAEWLASLADKFANLSDGTKKFLVIGTALAGIFSAIVAAIGIAMVIVGNVVGAMGTLAGAMGIAGGAGGLLSAVFAALTGPIGIAIAAITAIIAAVVLAYNKIDWFRDMVDNAWKKIKEYTKVAFDAIKSTITTIVSAVVSFAKTQLDKFQAFWDENGKAIMAIVKIQFDSIVLSIKTALGIIKGVFEMVWPIITSTVRYAWETIKLIVSTAINIVLGVIQTVLKVLQGDWKGAWETIKGTVKAIWDDIGAFLKGIDLKQTGKDIINGLIRGISSMGSAVLDAAKGIGNSIKNAFTSLFDINSPSRWMRDMIGENMISGWINGLTGMKPEMIRATELASKWMTPATPQIAGYSLPSASGTAGKVVGALETRLQTQFAEAEKNRGDIVLNVDGTELARIQQPHLDTLNGQSFNLALYTKGGR